jgi:hypothetical protein
VALERRDDLGGLEASLAHPWPDPRWVSPTRRKQPNS